MKWIKCNERLPNREYADYVIRQGVKMWIACFTKELGWEFLHNGKIAKQPLNYEWLDESSQPSTAKWSDSDVKKFLEDYRVANREIYLNPEIWFDKLNDEK